MLAVSFEAMSSSRNVGIDCDRPQAKCPCPCPHRGQSLHQMRGDPLAEWGDGGPSGLVHVHTVGNPSIKCVVTLLQNGEMEDLQAACTSVPKRAVFRQMPIEIHGESSGP